MIYCGLVWSSWQPKDRSVLFIGSYTARQVTLDVFVTSIFIIIFMNEGSKAAFLTPLHSYLPVTWECSIRGVTRERAPSPGSVSPHHCSWWHEGLPWALEPIRGKFLLLWTNDRASLNCLNFAKMETTDASLESFKLSWWKMSHESLGILPDMHFL